METNGRLKAANLVSKPKRRSSHLHLEGMPLRRKVLALKPKSGGFWHFLMVLFKHKHIHFTLILIISYLSEIT